MFSLFINTEKGNKILLSIQKTPKKSSKCSWVLNNEAPSLEPSHKKGAGVEKKLDWDSLYKCSFFPVLCIILIPNKRNINDEFEM
jgi:hypothetical protein